MPIRTARTLPTIFIDHWMPFLPWTGWFYVLVGYTVFLLALVRDSRIYNQALRACAICFTINSCFWFFYPTVMQRPPMPDASFANFAYRLMATLDTPMNCFPSGHLAFPLIACWAFASDRPALRWIVWTFFSICSISVLTTKQHYFVDIPAGVAISMFSIFLAYRMTLNRQSDTAAKAVLQK
ncbi:MAG TPA: phosphatase PAP2 family protein [Pyrinomonadaceae bacterium]|nr:phosphatase PAP2 family protein [Pyrinomonadaceae bacterium]